MSAEFDPLDFLVDKPRTRAVILAELQSAERKVKQTEPVIGQARHPWRERLAFVSLLNDLGNELREFDWAAKSPLEQLEEHVRTAEKELDHRMNEWVDKKNDLDGKEAASIRERRLLARKLLAQAQNDLAVFSRNGTLPPTMPQWVLEVREVKEVQVALPIMDLSRHSAAAQKRLDEHIQARSK